MATELEIGIACGQCNTYSPMNTLACPACGHELSLFPSKAGPPTKKRGQARSIHPGGKLARMSMGPPAAPVVAAVDRDGPPPVPVGAAFGPPPVPVGAAFGPPPVPVGAAFGPPPVSVG